MAAVPAARRNRVSVLIELALVVAYFASRLFHLMILPIFVDESVHLSWAIRMAETHQLAGITQAGKFLPIWIMSLLVRLAGDLLWTERLLSVGIGVFGLAGCYLLGRRLFGRPAGLIAAGLYLITPFIFFYDRMALVDGLLTALAIYVALLSFELVRSKRVRHGIGLGLVLALAISTKLNGATLCLLPLLVVGAYLFKPAVAPPWKGLALAYAIALLGFAPLAADAWLLGSLSSLVHFDEIRRRGMGRSSLVVWQVWLANAGLALQYLVRYVTPTLFLAAGAGGVLAVLRRRRDEIVLLGMAGVVTAPFVLTGNPERWYPRYLLPAVPFVVLVVARTIALGAGKLRGYLANGRTRGWAAAVAVGAILVISAPALWFDYWLLVDPVRAPLVEIDRFQYINGEPSGYGLPEAAGFLREELSRLGSILVVCDKESDVWRSGLEVYLYDQRQHVGRLVMDFSREDPGDLIRQLSAARDIPVFVLFRPTIDGGLPIDLDTWPYSRHVAHFDKPDGQAGVDIYRVSMDFAREQPAAGDAAQAKAP